MYTQVVCRWYATLEAYTAVSDPMVHTISHHIHYVYSAHCRE